MVKNGGSDPALVIAHREKIETVLKECIERMRQTSEQELLRFMREQNSALIDWLDDENRWLAVLNGETVEPRTHKVHAIMLPAGGGGS